MDIVRFCLKGVMWDFGQEVIVCCNMVIEQSEVVLLLAGEVG